MKFLDRLKHLVRVELGHALLGQLEEHRLPVRTKIKYVGPVEALKAIQKNRQEALLYDIPGALDKLVSSTVPMSWKPINLSKNRWRKDAQLFFP